MSEYAQILIIDSCCDIAALKSSHQEYRDVVCLFWAAASTKQYIEQVTGGTCYDIRNIAGGEQEWGREAHQLVQTIVDAGPEFNGIPVRKYIEEGLYRELIIILMLEKAAVFADRMRVTYGISEAVIATNISTKNYHVLEKCLSAFQGLSCKDVRNDWSRTYEQEIDISIVSRAMLKYRETLLTKDWLGQFWNVAEWCDKDYAKRRTLGKWLRPRVTEGEVCFFSSYLNNSRSLLPYTKLIPRPVHWVMTNHSAAKTVELARAKKYWIWSFSKIRSSGLMEKDFGSISKDSGMVSAWLETSRTWRSWNEVENELLRNVTACWVEYLDAAKPKLVVTANQWGIEGWITLLAQRKGIPVLQIIHGVLGGHLYTRTPVISDALVVYGEFWKQLWPEGQRHKITAYNSQIRTRSKPRGNRGRRVTYFSWPLQAVEFHSSSEILDGLINIFHTLITERHCTVSFRAHPQENPSFFVNRWQSLHGSLPAELTIGKNEPLDVVLENTDIALMFRSTVMLNCIAAGIPVIIPGWIDYGWDDIIRDVPMVYSAADFSEIEKSIADLLDRPDETDAAISETILRRMGEGAEEIRSLIDDLIARNQRALH